MKNLLLHALSRVETEVGGEKVEAVLARTVDVSLELLDSVTKLDRGLSKNRSEILKVLVPAEMKLAKLRLQTRKVDEAEFSARKAACHAHAKELIQCLGRKTS